MAKKERKMYKRELIRKIAEWSGFTFAYPEGKLHPQTAAFNDPEGEPCYLPNFPEDLNALFKWAVPAVRGKVSEQQFVQIMHDWLCDYLDGKDAALALCLVIEKLIDSEGSDGK